MKKTFKKLMALTLCGVALASAATLVRLRMWRARQ